jgi:putative ABC transport system permease protein
MNSVAYDNIRSAINSVRTNKSRSLLTMLGIIVGVVSVISIVSIGQGVKNQISSSINHVGNDLITIRPGRQAGAQSGFLHDLVSGAGVPAGTFSGKEVEIVKKTKGVSLVAPLSIVSGRVIGGDHNPGAVSVIGTNQNLAEALRQKITYGDNLDDSNRLAPTAILGARVAERMFDDVVPLGRSFTIRGEEFHVAGLFDDMTASSFSSDIDFNNAIFIPYDSAQRITDGSAPTYEILLRPRSADDTDKVIRAVTNNLSAHRGGQEDFSVLTHAQTAQVTNDILGLMTALVGGVAAISLLVGGVGIMNIMLVSVTERMHEIGIRKAVGATNRQVLEQFITESAVLSLGGGFIGVFLAYLINIGLRLMTDLKPIISWQIVLLTLFVSLAVGVIFGSAPALKAARKDPISALRNE